MLGSSWSEAFQRGGQEGKETTHSGADHHCTAGGRGRSGPRQIREADEPGARHHRADVLRVEAGVRRDEGEPGARRLKELERENGRLKRAVADLTLDKLILEEAAKGNFRAPSADDVVWCVYVSSSGRRRGERAGCLGSHARPIGDPPETRARQRPAGRAPRRTGLGSSFRDWAAEKTDHPREVIEAALAHVVTNRVEAAYRRTDLFERRRVLMDNWAAYLAGERLDPEAGPAR